MPNPAKEGSPGGTLVFPTSDGAVNFPRAVVQSRHRAVLRQRHGRRQHLLPVARPERSDRARAAGRNGTADTSTRALIALDYRTGDVEVAAHAIPSRAGDRASSRGSCRPAAACCSPAIRRATSSPSTPPRQDPLARAARRAAHQQPADCTARRPPVHHGGGRRHAVRVLSSIEVPPGGRLKGTARAGYDIRQGTIANSVRAAGGGSDRGRSCYSSGAQLPECLACKSNGRWMNVSATPWHYWEQSGWRSRFLIVPSPPFSPYLSPVANLKNRRILATQVPSPPSPASILSHTH